MKLDPRTKLFILAITSVSVFLNGSIIVECVFVGLPLLLLFSAGRFRSAVKYSALFLVLLAVQLWLVPVLPVSAGGIVYMFAVYIRKLIPCFMLGSFLISTTRVSKFLAAVGRFRLPKGFTISLSITLRYFPTMKEEWSAVKDAMALRGIPVTAGGFLRHPMRTMEYVYVPMLVSASKISDEITQAAITRGIDHVQRRTCIENVRFHIWDGVALACYIGMVLFAVLAAVRGWA